MRYFLAPAPERLSGEALAGQARLAEAAGCGAVCWAEPFGGAPAGDPWEPAAEAARATEHIPFGIGVEVGPRVRDAAAVARRSGAFEARFPGRSFLGIGRPRDAPGDFEETAEAVRTLLIDRSEHPPPIYVTAAGEEDARIAGRLADGLWALAGPGAERLVSAYRESTAAARRPPGPVMLQEPPAAGRAGAAARRVSAIEDMGADVVVLSGALEGPA